MVESVEATAASSPEYGRQIKTPIAGRASVSLAGEIAGPPMRDLIVARVPATEASLPHPALSDRHRARVDGQDIVRGGFGGEHMSIMTVTSVQRAQWMTSVSHLSRSLQLAIEFDL